MADDNQARMDEIRKEFLEASKALVDEKKIKELENMFERDLSLFLDLYIVGWFLIW
jgi:hypothetical protein